MIYQGQQDLTPLFRAISMLGPRAERVRLRFYGRYNQGMADLAAAHGVSTSVETHELVPYRESMRIQTNADVLMLVVRNNASGKGIYTGKLFEYLGAGRPILALVPSDGVAARLLEQRGAGVVSTDAAEIAKALERWLEQKEHGGAIPGPSPEARRGLTRRDQTVKLVEFLQTISEA